MTANVSQFDVWQDFMPTIGSRGAPLHAVVGLELAGYDESDLEHIEGTITLIRETGERLIDAPLVRQGYELMEGDPNSYLVTLSIEPAAVAHALREGEAIKGTALVRVAGREVVYALPATPLLFTF